MDQAIVDHSKIPARDECVVGALLQRWAKDKPDHPLFVFTDGAQWSFKDTLKRTQRAAAGLRQLGVKQGDHVLCWMPNTPEAILTWFGANYLGAVFVPVNTAYRGGLLQHVLTLAQAEVLVVHASLMDRLADVDTGTIKHIIVVGGAPVSLKGDYKFYDASALQPDATAEPEQPVEPWHPIYVMFTSGTTGPSKAVVSAYIQVWSGATMALPYFKEEDRLLVNLPLFHVTGVGSVMDRLTKGGTCVVHEGFKTDAFWDVIRQYNITGCCLIGAMTRFLLKQPPSPRDKDHPLRNVTTVPWNQDSLIVAERYGLNMYTAFNMTEIATPIAQDVPNPPQFGTCGRLRGGQEARVVDVNDNEVPVGEVGELVVRTSRPWEITTSYFRNPEATAAVWRNGWFHTGDTFRKDADGYFYFVDRQKDAIRRRGENISSFEVESEAAAHTSIADVAVIPVPSEFGEDEVMLVVAPIPGKTIDQVELLRFLEPRMAHFMLPRYIRVMDALPKTPTAKVEKHRLRTEGITPDTWDREAHGVTVRHGKLHVS